MEPDFIGLATAYGVQCSDGRTIKHSAFDAQDGEKVPLVWKHDTSDPNRVLGHCILHADQKGMVAEGFFNRSDQAASAKELLAHGDVSSLSIYANHLLEEGGLVHGGIIREVSLVPVGANPGAKIEHVAIQHADGFYESETEAIIYPGVELRHEDIAGTGTQKAKREDEDPDATVRDVLESMSEAQLAAVDYLVTQALELGDEMEEEDPEEKPEDVQHSDGGSMPRNLFAAPQGASEAKSLSHAEQVDLMKSAQKAGSLVAALKHADMGWENIAGLFPEPHILNNPPKVVQKDQRWVGKVLGGVASSPYPRVRNNFFDLQDEDTLRALGYKKGEKKTDVIFKHMKRVTEPHTIYVKTSIHRDDLLDIQDFDALAILYANLGRLLDREKARAILFGDGRGDSDANKIPTDRIRPIAFDDALFTITHKIEDPRKTELETKPYLLVDEILRSLENYQGSGNLTMFINQSLVSRILTTRNATTEMRLYNTMDEVCAQAGVSEWASVPMMKGLRDPKTSDGLMALIVDLSDYQVGRAKGGEDSLFTDFDIDYNQHKALRETRMSGALVQPYSAVAITVAA